jgi:hypothetical protein
MAVDPRRRAVGPSVKRAGHGLSRRVRRAERRSAPCPTAFGPIPIGVRPRTRRLGPNPSDGGSSRCWIAVGWGVSDKTGWPAALGPTIPRRPLTSRLEWATLPEVGHELHIDGRRPYGKMCTRIVSQWLTICPESPSATSSQRSFSAHVHYFRAPRGQTLPSRTVPISSVHNPPISAILLAHAGTGNP